MRNATNFLEKCFLITLIFIFSCGESTYLSQLRQEIKESEKVNARLIEESKANGNQTTQELQRSLENHSLLFVNYFQDNGDVDLEMTGTLIEYLEYYREHTPLSNADPSYQAYLPLVYGLQASLYYDDTPLAAENVKQSLRGFEEILDDHPQNPIVNIYYALILGSIPNLFLADEKAWETTVRVDELLVENQWEDSVPLSLRLRLYRKGAELAGEFETDPQKVDYFRNKWEKLKNQTE